MDCKSTEVRNHQKGAEVGGPGFEPCCVALRSSLEEAEEDWLASSQSSWLNRDTSLEKQTTRLKQSMTESGLVAEDKNAEDDSTEHLCSRHGKKMKSILQGCSEELRRQDGETSLMQVDCTPPSPHPPLLQSMPYGMTSSPSLHDSSSSTNISLFSQPALFTYLSVDEKRQVAPSQMMASSQTSPSQENNSSHFSGRKGSIALQVSPSTERSVQLVTPSPPCPVQPSLSHTSSTSTYISPFLENRITQKSLSTEQESSAMLSFMKMFPETSRHQPGSSSSLSSSSSIAPVVTLTPRQNDAQVSLDSHVILDSSSAVQGKLRLSLETQAFLLVCKWLQPQVKLYRLSQRECHQATLPNHASQQSSEEEEVDEDVLFDVNLLYSGSESESETQDSDSEYVPSKRCRYR